MNILYLKVNEVIDRLTLSGVDRSMIDSWKGQYGYNNNLYPENTINAMIERALSCTLKTLHARKLFAGNDFKYIISETDWSPRMDLREIDEEVHLTDKTELE